MPLPLSEPATQAAPTETALELIGVPLLDPGRRRPSAEGGAVLGDGPDSPTRLEAELAQTVDLLVEVARLRESLESRCAQIEQLEAELTAWHVRAADEAWARSVERTQAHERERDLIRILHRQITGADGGAGWVVNIGNSGVTVAGPRVGPDGRAPGDQPAFVPRE